MKKDTSKVKAIAGGVLFILAIILTTLTVAFYFSNRASATEPSDTDNYQYTIVDYNGKVSVIRRGEDTPYEIFDTYTDSLPEIDQAELKKGVRIYSDVQLQKAIEDYTS
ncbi:MAG: hypothetical protein ACLU8W_06950 [Clostridia bacterium]